MPIARIEDRSLVLLFSAGINLMLLQLFMIREFSIAVWSMELVILAITVAYFVGCSIGYLVSHLVPAGWMRPWLLTVAISHLPLVILVRILGGWLTGRGYDEAALPVMFGIAALLLTSFYTVFLPRVIAGAGGTRQVMARAYSVELAGAAFGVVLAVLLGAWWFEGIAVVYTVCLVAVAWCMRVSGTFVLAVAALSVSAMLLAFAGDRKSIEYFYETAYRMEQKPRVLFSAHSPFQRVDVVDSAHGRTLFLNGLQYFNTAELESFNFFLSELPARLLDARGPSSPGRSALVVGSGSMSSLRRIAPFVNDITTVEIDPVVVDVGRRFFSEYNRLEEVVDRWTLEVDDAKHYLSTTERRFDLIIVDVPAPWYVQTGLLFTREFYALARERLKPDGLLSVYLSQVVYPKQRHRITSQILAALLAVFDDLVVVNAEDAPYGFVIAGDRLGFEVSQVEAAARRYGRAGEVSVLEGERVRRLVGDTAPSSFDNLDIVWHMNEGSL